MGFHMCSVRKGHRRRIRVCSGWWLPEKLWSMWIAGPDTRSRAIWILHLLGEWAAGHCQKSGVRYSRRFNGEGQFQYVERYRFTNRHNSFVGARCQPYNLRFGAGRLLPTRLWILDSGGFA